MFTDLNWVGVLGPAFFVSIATGVAVAKGTNKDTLGFASGIALFMLLIAIGAIVLRLEEIIRLLRKG